MWNNRWLRRDKGAKRLFLFFSLFFRFLWDVCFFGFCSYAFVVFVCFHQVSFCRSQYTRIAAAMWPPQGPMNRMKSKPCSFALFLLTFGNAPNERCQGGGASELGRPRGRLGCSPHAFAMEARCQSLMAPSPPLRSLTANRDVFVACAVHSRLSLPCSPLRSSYRPTCLPTDLLPLPIHLPTDLSPDTCAYRYVCLPMYLPTDVRPICLPT